MRYNYRVNVSQWKIAILIGLKCSKAGMADAHEPKGGPEVSVVPYANLALTFKIKADGRRPKSCLCK
jgi:hypothetical protein